MKKTYKMKKIILSFVLTCLVCTQMNPLIIKAEESLPQYYDSKNRTEQAVDVQETITVTTEDLVRDQTDAQIVQEKDSFDYGDKAVLLESGKNAVYRVNVPKEGCYYMGVDYYLPETSMSNPILSMKINGEYQFYDTKNLALEAVWKDKSQEYKKDEYGNDLYPEPERIFRWQQKQVNSTIYNFAEPFKFYLKAGENTIQIECGEQKFYLGSISFTGKEETKTFEEYKNDERLSNTIDQPMQVIEAEKYSEKTHSYIRGEKTTAQNLNPYDASHKKLNFLMGETWSVPNEGVTYRFTVEETGVYYFTFKYAQDMKKDMPAFKQIKVDGEYPMEEMKSYPFPYTKGGDYKNETLSVGGEKIPFYLEKGEHELSLTSTSESEYMIYEELFKVLNKANDIAMEIKVITGGKTDANRDWEIEEYLPNLIEDLQECSDILEENQGRLEVLSGKEKNKQSSNLKVAVSQLQKFMEDTNYLVNNIEQFVQGSNSVTEFIAMVLPDLMQEPLSLDQIYISTDTENLPNPKKSFMYNVVENAKKFALSFNIKEETSGGLKKDELNVWANRSAAHIDVIKEMVSEFEEQYDIKVNLSMMPDEQKLLLATSAGNAPDVVIGMSNYRPFDFALRGAMYDLREFDDFGEAIEPFESEMLIPFVIEDSCYALPETANFQVLFYRKDILEALQLSVPSTWDEVITMLPTLSRYDMDFGTTIATATGMKHFGATMPFIQQYNGKIYSEDGMKVELGDPNTVKAFELMTDLYTKYSLPENIPNFYNNFKKGITPVGIGDINTYILLKNAAPELAGQWGIAPSVGMEGENGEILRYQPSVASANGIMKSAENPEAAWEFMKWYMSDEVQIEYSNQLQLRFGPQYIWNTANMNAMEKSTAFSSEDLDVILEQLEQTMEIPRNPAYFAVEREVSNAWNMVVFDGVAPRTALDTAITKSNREITRKLKEFGYVDEKGSKIKDFTMATGELIDTWR